MKRSVFRLSFSICKIYFRKGPIKFPSISGPNVTAQVQVVGSLHGGRRCSHRAAATPRPRPLLRGRCQRRRRQTRGCYYLYAPVPHRQPHGRCYLDASRTRRQPLRCVRGILHRHDGRSHRLFPEDASVTMPPPCGTPSLPRSHHWRFRHDGHRPPSDDGMDACFTEPRLASEPRRAGNGSPLRSAGWTRRATWSPRLAVARAAQRPTRSRHPPHREGVVRRRAASHAHTHQLSGVGDVDVGKPRSCRVVVRR